jgi:hypothetical protein
LNSIKLSPVTFRVGTPMHVARSWGAPRERELILEEARPLVMQDEGAHVSRWWLHHHHYAHPPYRRFMPPSQVRHAIVASSPGTRNGASSRRAYMEQRRLYPAIGCKNCSRREPHARASPSRQLRPPTTTLDLGACVSPPP